MPPLTLEETLTYITPAFICDLTQMLITYCITTILTLPLRHIKNNIQYDTTHINIIVIRILRDTGYYIIYY